MLTQGRHLQTEEARVCTHNVPLAEVCEHCIELALVVDTTLHALAARFEVIAQQDHDAALRAANNEQEATADHYNSRRDGFKTAATIARSFVK